MQDRRKAFTVLGLPEDVGRQQIEDRYSILVKKYKYLAQDEQPSPGEPIFGAINEAYHYLIGYAPLQKVQFRALNWKEKFQHIRENYMMEITLFVVFVLVACAAGTGIHELYKILQAGTVNSGVSSTVESPLPISQDKTTNGIFREGKNEQKKPIVE
jgi:hypothetical protein